MQWPDFARALQTNSTGEPPRRFSLVAGLNINLLRSLCLTFWAGPQKFAHSPPLSSHWAHNTLPHVGLRLILNQPSGSTPFVYRNATHKHELCGLHCPPLFINQIRVIHLAYCSYRSQGFCRTNASTNSIWLSALEAPKVVSFCQPSCNWVSGYNVLVKLNRFWGGEWGF